MFEDLLKSIEELKICSMQHYKNEELSFSKRKQDHESQSKIIGSMIANTHLHADVRFLASCVDVLECDAMVIHSSNLLAYNELVQLELSVMISIHNIANELVNLKQPSSSVSEEDKDKIRNIEKEIAKLTRTANKWKPLISNLEEGIRRTNNVLRDNK